jgi:glycerol uptake facilitator protein
MTPFMGELVGTLLLVLIGDSVVANNNLARTKGHGAGWLAMSAGWGLAVFVAVYCVAVASGAHLNPAITIGLWTAGVFPGAQVGTYIAAQMIGGLLGAMLMWLVHLPHWSRTEDAAAKLGAFCNAAV